MAETAPQATFSTPGCTVCGEPARVTFPRAEAEGESPPHGAKWLCDYHYGRAEREAELATEGSE